MSHRSFLLKRQDSNMAFFPPEDGDGCADCGTDPAFSTDEYTDSLPPSPEDTVTFCLECYVERHEVCAYSAVRKELTDGTAELVIGGRSVEEAEGIAEGVADEIDGETGRVAPLTEPETVERFGTEYVRELSRGIESHRRNIYASTGPRGTVVDFETFTRRELRGTLTDELTECLLNSTEVRKRADAYTAPTEEFPVLAEHGVPPRLGIGSKVWELAKERGVSRRSERSIENQRAGEDFEDFFAEWCKSRNLSFRRGKPALRRLYPEVAEDIAERTGGLSGAPDFFLRGDGQRSFGSSGWRPDGDAFVEVKGGASRLSREQQDFIAHLKSHGFEVYVFRGEPDEYRFEKR